MEVLSSSSTSSSSAKPVVVRVKRKSNQERLDAFWLEINERPPKWQLLDIEGLSISDSSGKVSKEVRTKKLLVQHVETLEVAEAAKDVLKSYLPNFSSSKDLKSKIEEQRSKLKQQNKQEQLRSSAIQKHEDQVRSARFEQIWKSRKEMIETGDDSLHEICHLYDVVQVDAVDKNSGKVPKQERASFEDNVILCNYLPLLMQYVAEAAKEIESDLRSYAFGEGYLIRHYAIGLPRPVISALEHMVHQSVTLRKERNPTNFELGLPYVDGSVDVGMNGEQSAKADYVYDLYTVEVDANCVGNQEAGGTYPLVQVYEEDYYDGPSDSEYATDDSNAEDNPLNDYPDEESSGDEDNEDPFDYGGHDPQYEDDLTILKKLMERTGGGDIAKSPFPKPR